MSSGESDKEKRSGKPGKSSEQFWPCEVCGRKFDRKWNYRSHLLTHSQEKGHACEVCGTKFARSYDLKRHQRFHTDERPFACHCGEAFFRSDALGRHKKKCNVPKELKIGTKSKPVQPESNISTPTLPSLPRTNSDSDNTLTSPYYPPDSYLSSPTYVVQNVIPHRSPIVMPFSSPSMQPIPVAIQIQQPIQIQQIQSPLQQIPLRQVQLQPVSHYPASHPGSYYEYPTPSHHERIYYTAAAPFTPTPEVPRVLFPKFNS